MRRQDSDKRRRVTCGLVLSTGISIAALTAFPAAFAGEPPSGVLTVLFENDFFYNSDDNYTSGVGLAWAPRPDSAPDWAVRAARLIPWFPATGSVRHGYVLGQNVYTPRDIRLASPPRDDRPYAGWLYAAIGVGIETSSYYDQVALTLGVVGPASLAEASQKSIHEYKGSKEPRGWDTQLHNEPGIVLAYQRTWIDVAAATLVRLDLDVMPHAGSALGNVHTFANAGLLMRAGRNLAGDSGPLRIQPNPPVSGFFAPNRSRAWHLFIGMDGRAVARNIFLDGNTFQDSRSVEKETFIGELQSGLAVSWHSIRLNYTHVRRTREFKTRSRGEEYGAFSISMVF